MLMSLCKNPLGVLSLRTHRHRQQHIILQVSNTTKSEVVLKLLNVFSSVILLIGMIFPT
jgi:hypothetical protein